MKQFLLKIFKFVFYFSVVLSLYLQSRDAVARPLVIAADAWCPYNCDASSKDRGFMVDILSEALAPKGYTIDYRNMSWTTAVDDAIAGRVDGVIGAGTSEAKDLVIHQEPLGINKTCFYAKTISKNTYTALDSLHTMRLGFIAGYLYSTGIDSYIADNKVHFSKVQLVTGDRPLLQNVKKVLAGRIDALAENEMVMNFSFLKYNIEGLKNIGCDETSPLFVAFSPKIPDAKMLADTVNQSLFDLRKSGRMAKILEHYGVKDWKK